MHPVSDILEAAAAKLDATGWRQQSFGPQEGPNCAAGAILYCKAGTPYLRDLALDYLATQVGHGVIGWNDTPGRTIGEVTEALRRAAKQWHEDHDAQEGA